MSRQPKRIETGGPGDVLATVCADRGIDLDGVNGQLVQQAIDEIALVALDTAHAFLDGLEADR